MRLNIKYALILVVIVLFGCTSKEKQGCYVVTGHQSQLIVDMIEAVNIRDAEAYVMGFAENVQVVVASEVKIKGRNALRENRKRHFKSYPDLRSEIQNLVEIDNQVIMHDKVWLSASDKEGRDIVEIFTFESGKVSKVQVIQSKAFFQ